MDTGVQSSKASGEPGGIRVSSLNPASRSPTMYLCLVGGTSTGTGRNGEGVHSKGKLRGLTIQQADQRAPRKRDGWVRSWEIIWRDGPEPKAVTQIQRWEASRR